MEISLEKAFRLLEEQIKPIVKIQITPIESTLGMCLAEDVIGIFNQPLFDRSPLDGYALQAEETIGASKETPKVFQVVDKVFAGEVSQLKWHPKTAVRIMTGAPIPTGFDCIIRQENTDYGEEQVEVYQSLKFHENYCFAGEDVKAGQILIKKGTKIQPLHIGIMAGQGIREVKIIKKTRILLLTTGDELIDVDTPLTPGKIYNTNYYVLQARLQELGMEVVTKMMGDETEDICNFLQTNKDSFDGVITTGGVSVGQKDVIRDVVKQCEEVPIFWRVALKPGSPLMFWKLQSLPILSLSGNPFASLATFELFGRKMLGILSNDDTILPRWKIGILEGEFLKASKTRRFIRAYFEDGRVKINTNNHASGSFASTGEWNCLIDIAAGNEKLESGDEVTVVL